MLLAACATRGPPAPPLDAAQQRTVLQSVPAYSFQGRVAVRTASDGFQADIRWRQRGEVSDVRLAGPFGAGALQLHLQDEHLRVTDSHGKVLEQQQAAELLRQQLGFDPPLGALRYWLLGLAVAGEPFDEIAGPDGLTVQLAQQDWLVRYEDFRARRTPRGTLQLPRLVTATHDTLRLRLVIDRWQLD